MSSQFEALRKQYPVFRFRSFDIEKRIETLKIKFQFEIDGLATFAPTLELPIAGSTEITPEIETLVFELGMIELLSYWKATCAPLVVVEAGALTEDQIAWWRSIVERGLGEFFFRNGITPDPSSLITIEACGPERSRPFRALCGEGDLILVGGGKDSTLTLELLKGSSLRQRALILNPIHSAMESVRIAGYGAPLVASRVIDRELLELNRRGFLNGHTPFSAYLAFFGTLVAALHNYERVIVSNEQSANEGNVETGFVVNHQYSKTTDFEERFRSYATSYLATGIEYFSFLRPIHDLTVSRLFSKHCSGHFKSFRSCNVGQKENGWCGRCPKCAFVYLTLFPFVGKRTAQEIFGADLFQRKEIISELRSLCGLTEVKPFECVGTRHESIAALRLSIERIKEESGAVPNELGSIVCDIAERGPGVPTTEPVWTEPHFLPSNFESVLREAVENV